MQLKLPEKFVSRLLANPQTRKSQGTWYQIVKVKFVDDTSILAKVFVGENLELPDDATYVKEIADIELR